MSKFPFCQSLALSSFPCQYGHVMAIVLDGKSLAAAIREKVKDRATRFSPPLGLAVLLVGDDPASHVYVGLKQRACEEAGIHFEKFLYPNAVAEEVLLEKIAELNGRADIDGILVQLPLPAQDADRVIAAIDPAKDVDGFHPVNAAACAAGKPCLAPPVHLGVMKLIEATGQNVEGMNAVLVGSELFSSPLASLLKERRVTSTIVSAHAPHLVETCLQADILVTAVGHPGLITKQLLKPGAIVIDVGTTKVGTSVAGDVDRSSVDPVAGWVSPVPGGSGPLTVAYLLLNVLKARELNKKTG